MSLDQNLFTLHLTQNGPHVVDLVDPSGTIHYRKQRLSSTEYKAEVYDPISQSLLITATSPTATSKAKILELYNPTILVDLKYTGTLSFRWGFKWEEHDFEWKREECFMLRKPDPPVLVAVTKEPAGRLKTASVQILDYNLNRFDINDRKGLEIVILTALLVFQDVNEGYRTPQEAPPAGTPGQTVSVVSSSVRGTPPSTSTPPPPPPRPAPKTGVDRIAEMQAVKGEYNEISVEEEGQVDDYAQYCARLLEDDAMLFVTLRSAAAEQVPKVLLVVEQTKRIRHKAGLSEETELHQYVLYDTGEKQTQKGKGPRRINLDDTPAKPPSTSSYSPPTSLTVHLSKIDMPELQPKATPAPDRHSHANTKDAPHDKAGKEPKKKENKKATSTSSPPTPSFKARPEKLTEHYPTASTASSQPNSPGPSSHHTPQPPPFPAPQIPSSRPPNTDWNRPQRNSFYPGANPNVNNTHAPYGAYAPPPANPHSKPSNSGSGYTTTHPTYHPYAQTPSPSPHVQWQPPPGPPPAIPPRPPAQAGESASTQKPSSNSIVGGLFDSFRRW